MNLKVMLIMNLILSSIAFAKPEVGIVGKYNRCAQSTSTNGIEHSKSVELAIEDNESVYLAVKFYSGNSNCTGFGEVLVESRRFEVVNRIGNFPDLLTLTVKDQNGSGYYEMYFGDNVVLLNSSETLPVIYDPTKTIILEKLK